MRIAQRLAELEIELPPPPQPVAAYRPVVIAEPFAFVSGQIPLSDRTVLSPGTVGEEISTEEAERAARRCALQALAALEVELGDLDRVSQIVKLDVFVASTPDFTEHPYVANGASDVLQEIFGDAGVHARVAVGVSSLPLGACVEVVVTARID